MRFFVLLTLSACGARTDLGGTKPSTDAGSDAALGCHDEIIATDSLGAGSLAVDGDDVFWGTPDGFVRSRHAGVITTLASMNTSIDAIAVDATTVYFAILGSVMNVPRAGGPVGTTAANAGQPFAIAAVSTDLFWVDYGAGIAAGSISRNGAPILTMLDTPGRLAVTDSSVYATCALALVDQKGVMGPLLRANHDGSGLVALAEDLHEPTSVVAFGGRIYYIEQVDAQSELHGGVRSIDQNGGAPKIEVTTDGRLPIDVAVDDAGVYVTTLSQVESALLHGSTLVASTPGVVYEVVRTSATAIYWTIAWTSGSLPPADGASVRKICK